MMTPFASGNLSPVSDIELILAGGGVPAPEQFLKFLCGSFGPPRPAEHLWVRFS
jgi:hypothetical protein